MKLNFSWSSLEDIEITHPHKSSQNWHSLTNTIQHLHCRHMVTYPDMSCQYAIPLISLSDCLFLNQQVLEPTRKSNILDLIFSPDDFIISIDVTDSIQNWRSLTNTIQHLHCRHMVTYPDMSCQYAIPLISLSDCLFLNQQVLGATCKSNILDLIFSPDDFIISIDVTDSVLSDHRIITAKTLLISSFATLLLFATPQTVFVMLLSHLISGKLLGQVFVPPLN